MPASFTQRAFQRGLALCLSTVLTLAMLGGIDRLALPDDAATGMAGSGTATQHRA